MQCIILKNLVQYLCTFKALLLPSPVDPRKKLSNPRLSIHEVCLTLNEFHITEVVVAGCYKDIGQ